MTEISNILKNINEIQRTKNNINNLCELLKLQKNIKDAFNIKLNGDKIKLISGNRYNVIGNEADGNCFFYSIIDSGVEIKYKNEILNNKYENNRKGFVTALRQIAIDEIKHKNYEADGLDWGQITNSNYTDSKIIKGDINKWYDVMLKTGYWANQYMISNLCEAINITPILLEYYEVKKLIYGDDSILKQEWIYSNINKIKEISCGAADKKKHNSKIDIMYGSDIIYNPKYFVDNYNDINALKKSNDKFILMWWQSQIHFETLYVKSNENYIGYFNTFSDFEKYNPELAKTFITKCNFISLSDALSKEIKIQNKKAVKNELLIQALEGKLQEIK